MQKLNIPAQNGIIPMIIKIQFGVIAEKYIPHAIRNNPINIRNILPLILVINLIKPFIFVFFFEFIIIIDLKRNLYLPTKTIDN